ncbi:MAG TPA: hypothetical protein PKY66_00830, partial [Thermoflexales bacterium]|nr:hypothetical protein [Thermoflexales bacterium]
KLLTAAGSTLRFAPGADGEQVRLRVNGEISNSGALVLTSTSALSNWEWLISAPMLTNRPGGQINVALSQARAVFGGQLINQGIFNVDGATILTTSNIVHTNTGTINLAGGFLDAANSDFVNLGVFNFSGTSPAEVTERPGAPWAGPGEGGLWDARSITNGPGGNINAGPGVLSAKAGAPRPMSINRYRINGELRNHGTLNVSAELTVTYPGAVHSNAGVIQINDGFLSTPESLNNSGVINFNGLTATASAQQPLIQGRGIWIHSDALTNTMSGTLNIHASAIDGVRIEAQLANQGTLNVNATMVLTQAGSTHTNTGTINLNNDLEIGGEFSNNGVMNFGSATFNGPAAPAQTFRVIGQSGLLANGPGGTINALQHAVVEAQLANQGTINVNATMVLTQA